ncbi:hypothetical protein ACWC2K_20580 [Streptomyces chattanoogensis]|uniref:hypothetical protein n=1 Tax=Streptomyces chattanoogensis TaxID=66876 RepID=UPI003687D725
MGSTDGGRRIPLIAPHRTTRVAVPTAVVTPPALIGLAVLATNPDHVALGMVVGTLVLLIALFVIQMLSGRGWVVVVATVLGFGLLWASGPVYKAEVMAHRGVRTKVVVTAAHRHTDGEGEVYWRCDVQRADGSPLPHATLDDSDCRGAWQVGRSKEIVVDPDGWVAPQPVDSDSSGRTPQVVLLAVAAVLFALLVLAGNRLRPAAARNG